MEEKMVACSECGALLSADESCAERFDRCLAKEFEDWTGYGAVHHLSVTCYWLQHPSRYSRQGWLEARGQLADYLMAGKAPAKVRAQNRQRLDSGRRAWHVTRGERVVLPEGATWSRTVADVRLESAAAYCADVIAWARAVLSDTEPWGPLLGEPG